MIRPLTKVRDTSEVAAVVRGVARQYVLGETPIRVFMYHSVHGDADRQWGPWKYAVTPETFADAVADIDRKYDIRPLSDIVASCASGSPPTEPTAAITFDDGFRDSLTEAVPVLERYDAPATVYVTTGFIGEPGPYEYRLAAALIGADHVSVSVEGISLNENLDSRQATREVYEALRQALKPRRAASRSAVLESIDEQEGPAISMLNDEELRRLDRHPSMEIGAHGHEHVPLTAIPTDAMERDIQRSKSEIERKLGRQVSQFSYPYGAHSRQVAAAVASAGFESAVATVPRRTFPGEIRKNRFRIPRIDGAERAAPLW